MKNKDDIIIERLEGLKDLINEKFKRNDEYHLKVDNHLITLNGQVASNTKFRYTTIGATKITAFLLGTGILTVIISYLL